MGRTGDGSSGWSIWRARRRVRSRSIWPPAPATSRSCFTIAPSRTIGLDVTRRMIELAKAKRAPAAAPAILVGDMTALPFPSASFDLVTTGYGLRNVPDLTDGDR